MKARPVPPARAAAVVALRPSQAQRGWLGAQFEGAGTRAAGGLGVPHAPQPLAGGSLSPQRRPFGVRGGPSACWGSGGERGCRLLSLGVRCAAGVMSGTCEPQPVSWGGLGQYRLV